VLFLVSLNIIHWHDSQYLKQLLILPVKRLYRCFGSGSNHKLYAYFIGHSKQYNKGHSAGLLRASKTRFASFYYAMHWAHRCHQALESTVHLVAWNDLKHVKAFITHATDDVKDLLFWKSLFILLSSLFSRLKLLRLSDSNKPNMDKVVFYLNTTHNHLKPLPLKMAKNIFGSIITKLSGLVDIGLIRVHTKFERKIMIRS